jgi:hypothetical protein
LFFIFIFVFSFYYYLRHCGLDPQSVPFVIADLIRNLPIGKKRLNSATLSLCVEQSASAESLNAFFLFAFVVAVAVIPLFIKRGVGKADGVFKLPFSYLS